MLAMRAGQPCVVHGVGGLRDTVKDRETGFVFAGDDPPAQAAHFTETVAAALALRADDPAAWQQLAGAAAAERFSWARSAAQYTAELYELAGA